MKINKIYIAKLLLLLSIFSFTYAYEGKMSKAKTIKSVKTNHCDIIYTERTAESAAILMEECDQIYEEEALRFGGTYCPMVVVTITDEVQDNQSFFHPQAWPLIVICDTALRDDSLSYKEMILTQFRHEITSVLGGYIQDSMKSLYGNDRAFALNKSSFIDGFAIVNESIEGNGRLNDEYFKHVVKQAKLEDKFPSIWQIRGAQSTQQSDRYHNFWAMYSNYVFENNSIEEYLNAKLSEQDKDLKQTITQWFEDFFGSKDKSDKKQNLKLVNNWNQFKESITLDNVQTELFASEFGIADFFTNQKSYSKYNKLSTRYSNLQYTDNGYYYLDTNTSAVYHINQPGDLKPKRVCSGKDITKISVSKDGKYITATYDSQLSSNTKSKVSVYNTQTKKWSDIKGDGLFENELLMSGNDYYLISTKYANHLYSTEIVKLVTDNTVKLSDVKSVISYNNNQRPICYADNNGQLSIVVKNEDSSFAICNYDLQANITASYSSPLPDMFIKMLSVSNGKGYFSWAVKDSMPRLGILDFATGSFSLDTDDFSGGVFYPVEGNQSICYIGSFYDDDRIFTRQLDKINTQQIVVKNLITPDTVNISSDTNNGTVISTDMLNQLSKNYNPFEYFGRPYGLPVVGIPISLAYSKDYITGSDCYYWQPFGVSLFSSDPWKDGHLRLHIGYGLETNSVSAHLSYFSDPDTGLYSYTLKTANEFDFNKGWKLSNLGASFGVNLPFFNDNTIKLSVNTFANYGHKNNKNYDLATLTTGDTVAKVGNYLRSIRLNSAYDATDNNLYLYSSNSLGLSYSYIKQLGIRSYNKAGFELAGDLHYLYNAKTTGDWQIYKDVLDIGFNLKAYFPGFAYNTVNEGKYTYNAPSRLIFSLFPYDNASATGSSSLFFNTAIDSIKALAGENKESDLIFIGYGEVVLFGMDIGCSLPLYEHLALNDFKVSLTGYDIIYDSSNSGGSLKIASLPSYLDGSIHTDQNIYLGLRTNLGMSFTMGLASGVNIGNMYFEGLYNLNSVDPGFKLGMGFAMDF